MGFIGGLLGIGTNNGAQFQAQSTPIAQAANTNQTNALYNQAQSGLSQQQNFANAVGAQNGLGNQSAILGQQQGLANQLQSESMGQGPNPAQAALNQNTAANTQNQAALMAGQRGSSANAGLIARQAAQQGAANQQNAVGQGATLQAQQQLNAQSQLAGQQSSMQNVAGQQVANQQNALGQLNSQTQGEQGALLGAVANQNSAAVSQQNAMNAANAGVASTNAQNQASLTGGLLQGGAGLLSALADGGVVHEQSTPVKSYSVLQHLRGPAKFAKGGQVPALVSPGETYLPPNKVKEVSKGKNPLKVGEKIPGKPKYAGNNYANDTVKKTLKSGGIVIPNSVMQSEDPSNNARKFVTAILAKQGINRR